MYDHQQKLLKNFPAAASISEVAYSSGRNCIDKSYCYYIDGDYYCYKFGRLMAEEVYVTTYETEKDCFEVKTPYQVEHDLFCDMIDAKGDAAAEQCLTDMIDHEDMKTKYPTLVLTRRTKNQ